VSQVAEERFSFQMSQEKHNYQWDSTENALTIFSTLVKKKKNDPDKFFLETLCFATEKYDGSNLAKDESGQIYSKNFLIEEKDEEFIKTSLRKIREANVADFKNILIKAAGLDGDVVTKCIVYGEFICNSFYDYAERGIIGDWKVFGAKLEVQKEGIETLAKLTESGFAVPKRLNNPNQVKIYPNEKFFELAKQADLDVPDFKGSNENIANIIADNKTDMKRGVIEGVVITIYQEESGHRLIKWKGSQEFQPNTHANFLKANDLVQKSGAHKDVKIAFLELSEVITDISENELALEKTKSISEKGHNKESKENKVKQDHCLSSLDKDIIHDGISHSQKKFDSVEKYKNKGTDAIEEYKESLIVEVSEHLDKERRVLKEVDDGGTSLKFIRDNVESVIKSQLADQLQ